MTIAPVSVARSSEVGRAAPARVGERVGEEEPPLGVGVRDLDRLPVQRGDDVAGPDGAPTRHVLGRRNDGEDAHGQPERGDGAEPAEDGGAAAPCRSSSRPSASAGLSERPPLSKVTALPTRPTTQVAARTGRLVLEHDQAGLGLAALRHRPERAHSGRADLRRPERLDAQVRELARDLGGALGERGRRQLVRRAR